MVVSVKDNGTRNAIFIFRMIPERAVQMQEHVFLCFIDFTTALDKVRHKELIELLGKFDLIGKYIKIMKNLYGEQTDYIRIGN